MWFIILSLFRFPINSFIFHLLVDHFTKIIFLEQLEKHSLYCFIQYYLFFKEFDLSPIANNVYHSHRGKESMTETMDILKKTGRAKKHSCESLR